MPYWLGKKVLRRSWTVVGTEAGVSYRKPDPYSRDPRQNFLKVLLDDLVIPNSLDYVVDSMRGQLVRSGAVLSVRPRMSGCERFAHTLGVFDLSSYNGQVFHRSVSFPVV